MGTGSGVISVESVGAMWADTAELAAVNTAEREFSPYGPSHWAVLAVFAIGSAALVWIGRRQSESGPNPPPCLSRSDCGDLRCGAGVFTTPADHRRFGAAAPDRSRDLRSGRRTVVATTLGLRTHLAAHTTSRWIAQNARNW